MTETRASSRSWIPNIPSPIQQLFEQFPLRSYAANDLPERSAKDDALPTLYIFTSEAGARKGAPSFNPSCLKWQTFLRIAGVQVHTIPSNNHASPNGALPFLLLPALSRSTSSGSSSNVHSNTIIPSSKIYDYALQHSTSAQNSTTTKAEPLSPTQTHREAAYTSLLDTPIRNAWLYALYLSPRNTDLLRKTYIRPCSNSSVVQSALLHQLRRAALAEIIKGSDTGAGSTVKAGWFEEADVKGIYAAADEAFEALETLLETHESSRHTADTDEKKSEPSVWFLGAPTPTLLDASVFAYTHLIQQDDADWTWSDDGLRQLLLRRPHLVAHAKRLYDQCWDA